MPRVTRRGYANLLIDIRSQRWDVIAEKHDHRGLVQVAQLRDERFQRRIALLQKPAIVGQNGASAVAHLVGKGRLRAVGYAKVVIVIAAMILHGQAEDEVAPFRFRKLMQNGAVVLLVADKHALFFKWGHGGVQRKKAVKAQHAQIMITVVVHAVIPVDGRGLISPVPQHRGQAAHRRQAHRIGVDDILAAKSREHLKFRFAGTAAQLGHVQFAPPAAFGQPVIERRQLAVQLQILAQPSLVGKAFTEHHNDIGRVVRSSLRRFLYQCAVRIAHTLFIVIHAHQRPAVILHGNGGKQRAIGSGLVHHVVALPSVCQRKGAQRRKDRHHKQTQQRKQRPAM